MILLAVSPASPVRADSANDREVQIKAAFIYNFIKFIDWPEEKIPADSKSITIGIIGGDVTMEAFKPLKDKKIKSKSIVIKKFKGVDELKKIQEKDDSRWKKEINSLKKCHVLFICTYEDEKEKIPAELLNALKDSGILVIGEVPGFLENGGIINFVMENKKLRFEINTSAADRNGLKISSQLLKLAKRVIKEEKPKDTKK